MRETVKTVKLEGKSRFLVFTFSRFRFVSLANRSETDFTALFRVNLTRMGGCPTFTSEKNILAPANE
jgi:hypothetical protein